MLDDDKKVLQMVDSDVSTLLPPGSYTEVNYYLEITSDEAT